MRTSRRISHTFIPVASARPPAIPPRTRSGPRRKPTLRMESNRFLMPSTVRRFRCLHRGADRRTGMRGTGMAPLGALAREGPPRRPSAFNSRCMRRRSQVLGAPSRGPTARAVTINGLCNQLSASAIPATRQRGVRCEVVEKGRPHARRHFCGVLSVQSARRFSRGSAERFRSSGYRCRLTGHFLHFPVRVAAQEAA